MDSKPVQKQKKIEYARPEVYDLGPVMAVFGANCSSGSDAGKDWCRNGGLAGLGLCALGSVATYL